VHICTLSEQQVTEHHKLYNLPFALDIYHTNQHQRATLLASCTVFVWI